MLAREWALPLPPPCSPSQPLIPPPDFASSPLLRLFPFHLPSPDQPVAPFPCSPYPILPSPPPTPGPCPPPPPHSSTPLRSAAPCPLSPPPPCHPFPCPSPLPGGGRGRLSPGAWLGPLAAQAGRRRRGPGGARFGGFCGPGRRLRKCRPRASPATPPRSLPPLPARGPARPRREQAEARAGGRPRVTERAGLRAGGLRGDPVRPRRSSGVALGSGTGGRRAVGPPRCDVPERVRHAAP